MTTKELLRDALLEDAGGAGPANWDGVRTRGTQIRRRRRAAQGAVALVSVVAIVAGALAVAGAFSDDGSGTRRGVVATPPGVASDRIVVDRGDRIEVVSATDGQVLATLVTGIDSNPGGVSVTPDGSAIVYTRQSSSTSRCGTELVGQPLTGGGSTRVIVGFSHDPLVSPDGQWVAYVMNESCASASASSGDFLGLTNLKTGLNYRPYEQELGDHPAKLDLLAWSPDSTRLVYNEQRPFADGTDQKTFLFSDPPLAGGAAQQPVAIAGSISAATYLPDGHLLAVLASGNAYDIVELDGASVVGKRFHASGPAPSSMAPDPSGTRLLLTLPDGTVRVQEGTGAASPIASGVRSAAWLP